MKLKLLSDYLDKISLTSGRLDKTSIISELLNDVAEKDIEYLIYILQGKFAPEYEKLNLGISNKLIIKTLSNVTGHSSEHIEKEWANIGDIGELSEKLIGSRKQNILFSENLSLKELIETLKIISNLEGKGSTERKLELLTKLYSKSEKNSVKYITRLCIEDMRTGAGFGVIRDAIANSFSVEKSKIQSSYDIFPDIAKIGFLCKKYGKNFDKNIEMSPGKPLKVMLFQKAENISSAFDKLGDKISAEYKYDGFRLQIHRKNNEIKLFTRNLDDVSKQFPDIIEIIKSNVNSKNFIIDCEAIGINRSKNTWLPFQKVSRRIKRKYDIDQIIKEIPISLRIFDLIYENGSKLDVRFEERRKILSKLISEKVNYIELSELIISDSELKIKEFYESALAKGAEGIMLKNLDGVYKPGSRVGFGLKLKPTMENLDLVITAAEWGTGKRANWLSSFELSCKKGNDFLNIGKLGTGIKEKESEGVSFSELTKKLKKDILNEEGKRVVVKPNIIIEVAYEEIQKSENYTSGYALRFPRFVRLREDLSLSDVDDIAKIESLIK